MTPSGIIKPPAYSPVRHLAAALFPASCACKYMLMLTAYMDETGHSKDERQKFNGMGGLLTTEEHWAVFERKWPRVLVQFKIPYLHMSESMAMFAGWSKLKVDKLSAALWDIIEEAAVLPMASIVPMDDFNSAEADLRRYVPDPYFLAMTDCIEFATVCAWRDRPYAGNTRIAMVFSDQVEFRHDALRWYEAIMKHWTHLNPNLVDPPAFRDMRRLVPLQAADMVAYEIYKEYDRIYYGRDRKKRYGYERLEGILKDRGAPDPPMRVGDNGLMFHSKATLSDLISRTQQRERYVQYWKNQALKKKGSDEI